MNTRNPHAELIAKAALNIKAIELKPKEPFLWASGTYNPIYNDNRMLLGYEHRGLVTEGICNIIEKLGWNTPNIHICGTSLSGIAPATGVVNALDQRHLNAKLLIVHEGVIFGYNYKRPIQTRNLFVFVGGDYINTIVSSTPWAIPVGVNYANTNKLPFAYIRPNKKAHGKEKQIEGVINTKGGVQLIISNDDEPETYESILTTAGITTRKFTRVAIDSWMEVPNKQDNEWRKQNNLPEETMVGKKVIIIEDLISTGGSALKEVMACREAGAEVLGVISIFNYGLVSAKKAFGAANCPVYSVLTYNKLLSVAKKNNMFSETELQLLADWRKDQPNWGAKNGFPPVLKK